MRKILLTLVFCLCAVAIGSYAQPYLATERWASAPDDLRPITRQSFAGDRAAFVRYLKTLPISADMRNTLTSLGQNRSETGGQPYYEVQADITPAVLRNADSVDGLTVRMTFRNSQNQVRQTRLDLFDTWMSEVVAYALSANNGEWQTLDFMPRNF